MGDGERKQAGEQGSSTAGRTWLIPRKTQWIRTSLGGKLTLHSLECGCVTRNDDPLLSLSAGHLQDTEVGFCGESGPGQMGTLSLSSSCSEGILLANAQDRGQFPTW
jgi:hypothetical protein